MTSHNSALPVAQPRITIVTPSFNQGPFLEKTIVSVLEQGYSNLEYIVIDGGSTDESVNIIKKYEKRLAYWVSEKDTGQSNAINKGFARATGTILGWLNSDDYYLPGAIETIVSRATTTPDADVFVGIGEMVTQAGKVLHHIKPAQELTLDTLFHWQQGQDFLQPSCFFRDTAWRAIGSVDERIHIAFDVDLWMRMAKAGCRFVPVDRVLSQALVHESAKTVAYTHLMTVDFAIVAIRHGGDQVVRKSLEDMAIRLSWAEPNLKKILNNPLVRLLEPLISKIINPAVRRKDTIPRWLK